MLSGFAVSLQWGPQTSVQHEASNPQWLLIAGLSLLTATSHSVWNFSVGLVALPFVICQYIDERGLCASFVMLASGMTGVCLSAISVWTKGPISRPTDFTGHDLR